MKHTLIVVGDRVLIRPDSEEEKTNAGLYLPQGVHEKEKVQSGTVVQTGPGYPVPDVQAMSKEPWSTDYKKDTHYIPLQAKQGDHAIFLRNAAVDIEFEGIGYVIVSHSAILILIRDHIESAITEMMRME